MKKLFCVAFCAIFCMAVGSATVFGGKICENSTGTAGGVCGGNITVVEYLDWTPVYFEMPCTTHSRYDHWETTFERGSTLFESCSVCGDHRFIPISDETPRTGEVRIECTGTKKSN